MIVNALGNILKDKKGAKGLFVRTVLKEAIQDYILNFIYNHKKYKKLIFTGGTALRKIYGLPRLSEDLDFDCREEFSAQELAQDLEAYFVSDLQYADIETKISNNGQTVLVKFPKVLWELGLVQNNSDATMLFVRCDLVRVDSNYLRTEVHALSTAEFSFFVTAYDLPTLFAHKIAAFLQRDFFKGGKQQIAFKGRDVFDLVWFFERAKKSAGAFGPNWERLTELTGVDSKPGLAAQVAAKTEMISQTEVMADLEPFVESETTLVGFGENFKEVIRSGTSTVFV